MRKFKPYRGHEIRRTLHGAMFSMRAFKGGKEVAKKHSRRELEIEIDRICSKAGSELAHGACDLQTIATP